MFKIPQIWIITLPKYHSDKPQEKRSEFQAISRVINNIESDHCIDDGMRQQITEYDTSILEFSFLISIFTGLF